jgi:hypothetical protein
MRPTNWRKRITLTGVAFMLVMMSFAFPAFAQTDPGYVADLGYDVCDLAPENASFYDPATGMVTSCPVTTETVDVTLGPGLCNDLWIEGGMGLSYYGANPASCNEDMDYIP